MPGDGNEEIRVEVENILMSSQGPVVMLAPQNGEAVNGKLLPIFIDQGQALNIQLALKGELPPRPMTHDLFSSVLNELGAIVVRVVIEELTQNTFYASLFVEVEGGRARVTKRFDARPSDCIALAVRANSPIFVRAKVLKEAGIERKDIAEAAEVEVEDDESEEGEDLGVSR
ncbi:MAG: bifunctional nuclease family protein [Methanobacteriota archaeon]